MEVGRHTYGHEHITVHHWGEPTELRIGAFCSIADRVHVFLGGNHHTDSISTFPFIANPDVWPRALGVDVHPATNGDVVIGNDVWIGSGATIMSGVTVGDGAVIGAESCVTRDVRPYAIVAGNPAREVRRRFDEDTVAKFLEIRWWDWDDKDIATHVRLIEGSDVDAFVRLQEESPRGRPRWRRLLGSRR
jgi:acetyltransferase-like isoleucine patch superfamily enzyme